jgi:HD superfamily phosphohydrolase
MSSSPLSLSRDKLIVDSIHGDIRLKPLECKVIDTASFQRLRHLKQLQFGHVTYPGATHTRFAHSVGVLGIMARITEIARDTLSLNEGQIEDIRLAGLLHDVGHYPYSHLMEKVDKVTLTEELVVGSAKTIGGALSRYPKHEEVGASILTYQRDLRDILGEERAIRVANLFRRTAAADPQLSKLVHSSLDMDRLDFLQRDASAAGVPYGLIDLNYLLNNIRASPTGAIGVPEKAITAVDHFLLGRFFMYRSVYYHKTTFGLEEACRHLLRRARDAGKFGIPRDGDGVRELVQGPSLGTFTDAFVDRVIEEAAVDTDPVIKSLGNAIRRRRPPKLLREVQVLKQSGTLDHAGVIFRKDCKHHLQALAEKHHLPLGRFLISETSPLTLEKRGALMTEADAKSLDEPEKEEIIRVFIDDHLEPVSVVDVPHSIAHLCSNHFYQAFRLYLVRDDDTDDTVIQRMKDEIKEW